MNQEYRNGNPMLICKDCGYEDEQPKNMLGIILMDVRESLLQEESERIRSERGY